MSPANILIIEDEALVAEEIAMRLRRLGYVPSAIVDNAEDAIEYVRTVRPDMALVDIRIKGAQSGIEISRRFHDEFDVPVVFLTAHADAQTMKDAVATEPFGYVVKPFDERSLAATLDTALRRRHAEQKLAKMEKWLAATMNSIGDGVIATDREFRVSFINPVAERLCGWLNGSAIGRPATEVFRTSGPKCTSLADAIDEATNERISINLDECQLASADGSSVSVDDTLAPIRDELGNISGVVIVFRDATERKRHEQELLRLNLELEEQVQRRTAQLQAANSELASFSYSIAHDLRAPLRAIMGFATLVAEEHSDTLDAEGRRMLEIVTERAGQMATMIDDYLRLSGLSHTGLTRKRLDMTQLARDAWVLATAGVERPPRLVLDELPNASADEGMMRQVWFNLLSNAVKFTRSTASPEVGIEGRRETQQVHYTIRDNGVGFDAAHTAKLFRVFERLHRQTEFEGNGVGLCIVQRILHRHEGDVTIEGSPGKGARVEFWLPAG